MKAYTKQQQETANRVLRGYAGKDTKFTSEDYNQKRQFIFKAHTNAGVYFAIIGVRGGIIDAGWL